MTRPIKSKRPVLIFFMIMTVMLLLPLGSAVGGPENPPNGPGETVPVEIKLEKITFKAEVDTDSIKVLFNPAEVVVEKQVPWKEHSKSGTIAPKTEFTHGRPFKLKMDLTVDEEGVEEGDVTFAIMAMEDYINVNKDVKKPPGIKIIWSGTLEFDAILEKIDVIYTLFKPDGTPSRAIANCVFKEYAPASEQLKGAPRH